MKLLTAFVTVLTVLGFAGAASACAGFYKPADQTAQSDPPVWPPQKPTGA